MKMKAGLLSLILVFSTAVTGQQRETDVKFRLAQTYERNNDWEKALNAYEELYARDSTNVVLYESLQRCFLQLKRYNEALQLIQAQLRIRPNDIALMCQLGTVYARADESEKALSVWNRVLEIDKRNPNMYRVVASAAAESRMLDRAIDFYLRGRSECRDPVLFSAELAYLYSMMMNYANATKEYLNLIRLNPAQLPFVQSRMAGYTNRSDGLGAATVAVEDAVRADSGNMAFHQLLAWLLMEGKQFERAYDVYVRIDQRTNAGGREIYGFAERALKERAFSAARKAFENLIEKYPQFDRLPAAKFGYARSMEESVAPNDTSGDLTASGPVSWGASYHSGPAGGQTTQAKYSEAIDAYSKVVQEYPNTEFAARAIYRIALVRFDRLFDVDETIVRLTQLVQGYARFRPVVAEATILLGDALVARGELDEAARRYRSIMTSGDAGVPASEVARHRLAEVEFFKDNFQEATKLLQELTKNPKSDVTNDALSLLIFLTENSGQSEAPLKEFAGACLFIRQRKLPEALLILESIQKKYSQSRLADETLMLTGDVLVAMTRYADGITTYSRLAGEFPESILLDGAIMKTGQVCQWKLHDSAKAIAAYQSLLEKFPNSIYAGEARKRIRGLRGDNL